MDNDHNDHTLLMSASLDKLGWKKVFIDFRTIIPIAIPLPLSKKHNNRNLAVDPSRKNDKGENQTISSQELYRAFKNPYKNLPLPIAHGMITVLSKNSLHESIYRGGRPVVDCLVHDLVQEIYEWEQPEMNPD